MGVPDLPLRQYLRRPQRTGGTILTIKNRPGTIDDRDAAGTSFWQAHGRFSPRDDAVRRQLNFAITVGAIKAWRRTRGGTWWVLAYDDWAYRFTTRTQAEAFVLGVQLGYEPYLR